MWSYQFCQVESDGNRVGPVMSENALLLFNIEKGTGGVFQFGPLPEVKVKATVLLKIKMKKKKKKKKYQNGDRREVGQEWHDNQ